MYVQIINGYMINVNIEKIYNMKNITIDFILWYC